MEASKDHGSWWEHYRAAWCLNRLDLPDSALVYAERAFFLAPGEENALAEVLRALSEHPDSVLAYAPLVSGGGVCRFRLAQAELRAGRISGGSISWLMDTSLSGDSAAAADACCWLSLLFPQNGLDHIQRAVSLAPGEQFYRGILVERLVESGDLEAAEREFQLMENSDEWSYWSTAAELHRAQELDDLAIQDSREAFQRRQLPSTAADLGWRLYFRSRELIENGRMQEAVPLLYQCSEVWHPDCTWAVRADSLLDLMNRFTSADQGYGEPF